MMSLLDLLFRIENTGGRKLNLSFNVAHNETLNPGSIRAVHVASIQKQESPNFQNLRMPRPKKHYSPPQWHAASMPIPY